ncbi:acyl-CoA dehydrogenase [Actinomycetospora sp. TBRC 11914]|uniref:acyl-CoA dehydrogenase n=1 Tax=Actinomycetospora sp. TBRC 11914 TaxID=2729387 RepID=UPI00145CD6C0|nr:acyl-CoA dehydrogenase [Actinomycetospora sp. TBRC 11914]NMO88274.1 acyl-CoA dehydrogenase [Actinomycetospora sp. TBRC 11914]
MTIALDPEHVDFRAVLGQALERMKATPAAHAALDRDTETLPTLWAEAADQGWLALHLPEDVGGAGAGLFEAALVMEAVGEHCAPGPFLPTVLSAAVIDALGSEELRHRLLPDLASGERVAATGLVDGDGFVLGAAVADVLLLRRGDDLLVVDADHEGVVREVVRTVDRSAGGARVRYTGSEVDEVLPGGAALALRIGRVLAAAQAAGAANALVGMSTGYALVREQFGRPIGSFQAVKHLCADMLVAAGTATAAVWDASRPGVRTADQAGLDAAVAATVALPAFRVCAETNIQVHGGIGFTFDHVAHLYLRRAATLSAVFDPAGTASADVRALAEAGVTRDREVPLPDAADAVRAEARSLRTQIAALPADEQAEALAASGALMPEWPRPFGRAAGTLEQYVLKRELAELPRPRIEVPWVPMTIGQQGTPDQAERYLPGSLRGTVRWCQLSSEPDAGSDAAAVRTRAVRTDGGWLVTGQKVWTSHAGTATHGLATVRTDPDRPKHAGLSLLIVDMSSPGITVRPLREIVGGARPGATEFGETSFNEVFLDDVFVPDADVVGTVDDGWRLVRILLGNERTTIGERSSPITAEALLDALVRIAPDDAGFSREVGAALAEEQAVQALTLRRLLQAMTGAEPGPEAQIAKIVNSERIQRIADVGLRLVGTAGVDEADDFGWLYLRSRFTTIGGGTSQITRNVLAERVLGLPREVARP